MFALYPGINGSINVRLLKLILFASFTSCALITVDAQDKLGHLKEWVGRYPTDKATKPHREFVKLDLRQVI
jgi:hypothetical protein